MLATSDLPTTPATRASVYPPIWRVFAAALFVVSRISPPVLFAVLLVGQPPLNEPLLFRLFVIFFLLPAMAASLVRRAFAVDVELRGDVLVLQRGTYRLEVQRDAIEKAIPWHLPLPGPGVTLRGSNFAYSLAVEDPAPLLRALADRNGPTPPLPSTVAYAQARSAVGRARWQHYAGKYGLFPMPIVFLLFRLHQHLVFGGTLGQYYIEGLRPYLSTFGYYWILVVINLLLYASVWRGVAEGVSYLAASVKPASAVGVRRWAERAVQIAYYGGVPALLARRFLLGDS